MQAGPEIAVVEALKRFSEIKRIWLFGSRARGDNMPKADVDLAVQFSPGVELERWFDIVEAADAATLYKVDVVRLDEQSGAFRDAILTEGRVLYERH
jgi:predicted nucleotidyltransferase